MSKKDYELIARVIRELDVTQGSKNVVACAFAVALSAENTRFDRSRFVAASTGR